MSLVLNVDGERWRTHLRTVAEANPGLVPVVKGNGYGFTAAQLARCAQWLHDQALTPASSPAPSSAPSSAPGPGLAPGIADAIAVGTYEELPEVSGRFVGDIVVMSPWRPFGAAIDPALGADAARGDRLVHTISRVEDLVGLLEQRPDARFVLERMTSMRRHGLSAPGLREAGRVLREHFRARLEGVTLHLPLAQGSHRAEVERLMTDVVAAELGTTAGSRAATVWISHLTPAELAHLRTSYADFAIRPRIGTSLWLGDRGALRASAEVLDVHPLRRGDSFGYRARTAPASGHLLIVSGGTAHGIGLESPTGDASLRSRAATLARGGLDAAGFVRSPFAIDGRQRLFAEPPHMQASMLFLPSGARVPQVGEHVDVRVRFTTTTFDRIEID